MSFSPLSGCRGRSGMERVGETDQYFRVDVAGLPAGRPPAVALAASGYPALVEANLPRLVGAFVTPAVTWPSSAANAWGRRGRCLSPEGMTDLPGQRPRHGAGMRAVRRVVGITRSRSLAASWTRIGTTSLVGWVSKCR